MWKLVVFHARAFDDDYVSIKFFASHRIMSSFRVSLMDALDDTLYMKSFDTCSANLGMRVMKLDITHSEILDDTGKFLVNGDLHLQILAQIMVPCGNILSYTPTPFSEQMLAFYEDEENYDVAFQVEDDVYKLHSHVLLANAPFLGDLCNKQANNGSITPIVLKDVSSDIFDILMRYTYAGEIPEADEFILRGKEIIEAADKYAIINLKIATETALVQNCVLSEANVCEYLQFAHSKTCPHLKEYAIEFLSLHAQSVFNLKNSKETLESELMWEVILHCAKSAAEQFVSKSSPLSVSELREKLAERGLSLDGSNETLITRLEEAEDTESSCESSADESNVDEE